jgi:hypothetical protein
VISFFFSFDIRHSLLDIQYSSLNIRSTSACIWARVSYSKGLTS